MRYIAAYAITAIIFLALDSLWLGVIARSFYKAQIGSLLLQNPRFGIAACFYVVYVAGLVYFALVPGLTAQSIGATLLNAALFGFFCYLTYDATNLATLKGYTLTIAVADVAWGTTLTAFSAGAAFFIVRGFSLWPS